MSKILFEIEGAASVTIECNPGDNLLELARRANVAIDAPCSGNGSCGKCRVRLTSGELDSIKSRHISDEEWALGWRLSCNSKVVGDATVFVPDIASAYQSRMKTADLSTGKEVAIFEELQENLKASGVEFLNDFMALDLQLAEPTLDDTMPDNERLTWAIKAAIEVEEVHIPFAVMVKLASTLRQHDFHVCVKGRWEGDKFYCMEICGPEDTAVVGCAIDIGTTTVTMVLTDLRTGKLLAKGSSGNGQIRYGADVINRIIEQGRSGGKKKLQDAIVKETLTPIIANLCKSANISARSILRLSIGANTTMNHLLLGVDAESVRMEPYIPSFFGWEGLLAGDLKLPANPLAPVLIAPNIGSYVGGDITAGTLATMMWNRPELSVLIDLGTNGEIVFGNEEFLMSCACSAGPAFEGGDISCGMRATTGAIDSLQINPETYEITYSVIGDGKPVGLCGSGLIDAIAELFKAGIINGKGKFSKDLPNVFKDEYDMGNIILVPAEESDSGMPIILSEVDLDNFIRAKGSIFSALRTLLTSVGFTVDDLERVMIAGGIGSGINIENAIAIGMLPDIDISKYEYIGNSSLTGAYACLVSKDAVSRVREIGKSMTYIELSVEPGYMDEFIAACFLPHTDTSLFPSASC